MFFQFGHMIPLLDYKTISAKRIPRGKDVKDEPGNNVIKATENHF